MLRFVVPLVWLSLALVGTARAKSPDDAVPTPGIMLDGPALAPDEAFSHGGAVVPAEPASAGPRQVAYRNGAETRPAVVDTRCCAEHFSGGFGPLWASYCADRQRMCGAVAACEPARCCATPRCGFSPSRRCACRHSVRVRLHDPGCGCSLGTACDGACGAGMMGAETETTAAEPAPTPSLEQAAPGAEAAPAQTTPAVEPAPPPPPEPPAAQEAQHASSRRGGPPRRPISVR